jgi:hypothetical protein
MGRTACTEPQCLSRRAIPLLPLWAVRPVQSFSACTRVNFTLPFLRGKKIERGSRKFHKEMLSNFQKYKWTIKLSLYSVKQFATVCGTLTVQFLSFWNFSTTQVSQRYTVTNFKVKHLRCVLPIFFVALRPKVGHGLLILEVSRSHTTTQHSR